MEGELEAEETSDEGEAGELEGEGEAEGVAGN